MDQSSLRSLEPGSASLMEPSTPAADLKVWEKQVLAEETPLRLGRRAQTDQRKLFAAELRVTATAEG